MSTPSRDRPRRGETANGRNNTDHAEEIIAEKEYSVGYGRPPKHSRFRVGESGNPTGRPKRSRNLESLVSDELNRSVAVREGGKVRKMPKRAALLAGLINKALHGDLRAIGILIPLLQRIEADQTTRDQPGEVLSQDDEETVAAFLRRMLSTDPDKTG
jgi:Family of unknown function (DUF5681)